MVGHAETERLEIVLSATGADEGAVLLSDVKDAIQGIHQFLVALDERLGGKPVVEWVVADMHHSRPTIEIAPRAPEQVDRARAVIANSFASLDDIANGREIGRWGDGAIDGLKEAIRPIGRTLKSAALRANGSSVVLDIDFVLNFTRAEAKTEVHEEEWEGYLNEVNLAPQTPTFRLHPVVGRRFITCEFNRAEKERVKELMERKVSVVGNVTYRPGGKFPQRISVLSLQPLDGDVDEGFLGRLLREGGTGDLEEAMRKLHDLRDGWH